MTRAVFVHELRLEKESLTLFQVSVPLPIPSVLAQQSQQGKEAVALGRVSKPSTNCAGRNRRFSTVIMIVRIILCLLCLHADVLSSFKQRRIQTGRISYRSKTRIFGITPVTAILIPKLRGRHAQAAVGKRGYRGAGYRGAA